MVPGVYILLSSQEEEVPSSSWGHRCAHSAAQSIKRFKLLSPIILLCQGYCWIDKNTNNCFMVLIIRPGSTLKFQFVFSFNKCIWTFFFILSFQNFWIYIWVVVVWLLILRHRWLYFKSPLTRPPVPINKILSAKTKKYIPKCWEKFVKRRSNLNSIRVMKNWSNWSKNWSFDQRFLYMV